jgi:hypothetical protein
VKKILAALFPWQVLAAGLAILVFIVAEMMVSHSYGACMNHAYAEYGTQSAKDKSGSIASFIWSSRGFGLSPYDCTIRMIDRHNGFFAALGSLFVAFFTFVLWRSTDRLMKSSTEQGKAMERSIGEAKRSADAMEGVAGSMAINADQIVKTVAINEGIAKQQRKLGETQLRAYVSVLTGRITPQMGSGVKFAAYPILVNTGHTNALNLKYQVGIGILPGPAHLPARHRFLLPPANEGSSILPPQDKRTVSAIMSLQIWPELVPVVKFGVDYCLYVWGVVFYDDIFHKRRKTTFLHRYYWVDAGEFDINWNRIESPNGQYLARHNKAS